MARIEKKVDIKASAETIFKIIIDDLEYSRWNIVVKEVSALDGGKFLFKTTVGDVTSTRIETVQNKKIATTQEGGPITALGYDLNPKGDLTEAIVWTEFEDPNQEAIMSIAGDMFSESLKKYAEYLEAGGNPSEFNKKKK